MSEKQVVPFTSGEEYRCWTASNCDGCWKYDPSLETDHPDQKCEIENAICKGTMTGSVPESIWNRMGGNSGDCPEREETEPKFIDPNQKELELPDA